MHNVEKTLRMFTGNRLTEVRLLGCHKNGNGRAFTAAGYYANPETAAQAVAEAVEKYTPQGAYFVPNEIDPRCAARAPGRFVEWPENTTTDTDILHRHWLGFDVDCVKPAGVMATRGDKKAAKKIHAKLVKWLGKRGWPEPVLGDSGNGYWAAYPVDLPNDKQTTELIGNVLKAAAARFDTATVKIDQSVGNAARIVRLFGSDNAKGFSTVAQPHRPSRLLKVPAKLVPVPRELLEALASEAGASTPSGTPAPADGPRLVVPRYLAHFGREFRERKGNKWELAVCPFHPDHGGKDCIIGQKPSGAVWFRCLHNRCTGKRWQDVKRIIGEPLPEHYDPPLGNRKQERKPVEVIRFSEVKLVPVEYDWENVLARRKLTLFAGMMDTGKSLLTAYVASRYSKRRTFPCGNRARLGTSVLLGVEDDHADTVGPRLVAAGADLRRVVTVKSLGSLNRDLDLLEKTIKDLGDVVYLSFDPLSFYLDGVDLHRDNEIRGVLGRLVEMTRQYDITVSAVHHLTKKEDVAALHRLTGSAGIPAIARFVWFVVKDKLDPDRRLFLRGKGNLTAANIPGQSFRISAAELRADDGRVIETARIGWEPGTVNADPNEYLIGGREPADRRQERNDARQWLHDLLKDGPVPVRQVLQAAANNGHSPRTVRRAADELKVEKPSKGHGPGTVTSWKLPE